MGAQSQERTSLCGGLPGKLLGARPPRTLRLPGPCRYSAPWASSRACTPCPAALPQLEGPAVCNPTRQRKSCLQTERALNFCPRPDQRLDKEPSSWEPPPAGRAGTQGSCSPTLRPSQAQPAGAHLTTSAPLPALLAAAHAASGAAYGQQACSHCRPQHRGGRWRDGVCCLLASTFHAPALWSAHPRLLLLPRRGGGKGAGRGAQAPPPVPRLRVLEGVGGQQGSKAKSLGRGGG